MPPALASFQTSDLCRLRACATSPRCIQPGRQCRDPELLAATNLPAARCLVVAIPDVFESGNVVQQARQFKPGLSIIARAHSDEEFEHLRKHGASAVVMGENEMARAMLQPVPAAPPASPAPATAA